ncbi:SIR2 family protein [Pseudarthrobacter sp. YS3]|uniref:SIR2 family protein n=1 Tax=Pseudarthrobacter sp. YS3 TaxID=3453718 RepID=UPI003EEE25FF
MPRLEPNGAVIFGPGDFSMSASLFQQSVTALSAPDVRKAEDILRKIRKESASTEDLKHGMQLCSDLLGQSLFTDVTGILYGGDRQPGPIHRSIAAVAASRSAGGSRSGSGWEAIVTYNFDDLMGEALDAAGIARCAYVQTTHGVAGDPNTQARATGANAVHQRIYHLHGYTPRKLFRITDTTFTFSTAQYASTYNGANTGIIGEVFALYLARPVSRALYIGCSFQDEAMNDLLRNAAQALPGRFHYALIRWSGSRGFRSASTAKLASAAAPYLAMGVRPIWFDRFADIPALIGRLA